MLSQPALRDVVDQIGAAVGTRVLHHDGELAVSRKAWSAAVAVLLDEAAAARCGEASLPRRPDVIVVVLAPLQPTAATWQAAVAIGARQVLALPADEDELICRLAEAGEGNRDGAHRGDVVAVIGGRGGAGASVFAAALADVAGAALLVDLDGWGGGIDLLTGTETAPGLRWPDLALQGGRLSWSAVRAALPRYRRVSVLSAARHGYQPDTGAVDAVLDAGRRGGVTVICDVPRGLTEAAETTLQTAELVVLVSPCDVRSCAASAAVAPRLQTANPNVGLVVRGPSPGGLRAGEIADIAGLPLLAAMRAEPLLIQRLEHGGLRLPRRSALAAAARQVLRLLTPGPHPQPGKVAA